MDKTAALTPEVIDIVDNKGTEAPNTGAYNLTDEHGTYLCRRCGHALFRSTDKFLSSCGWPSFDNEIDDAIKRLDDKDGVRTEILCARCDAHLGHVFTGEYLTQKNLRHCVNSASIDFVANGTVVDTEEAIFAGGCFWGIEALLKKEPGVVATDVGYTGGEKQKPTYNEICHGKTGHFEAVRVIYDIAKTDYETVCKAFLECHDVSQNDGQGPDIGPQYRSAIFYFNTLQKTIATNLFEQLKEKGIHVATQLLPVKPFWLAEDYHQDYFDKTSGHMCHMRVKRF